MKYYKIKIKYSKRFLSRVTASEWVSYKFHKWNGFYFAALLPVLNEGRRGVTITTVLPRKAAFS